MEENEKTWVDYRIEELEEKAGFKPVDWENMPEYDMDGCRFQPYFTPEEELAMDDAYYRSVSRRLYRLTQMVTGM